MCRNNLIWNFRRKSTWNVKSKLLFCEPSNPRSDSQRKEVYTINTNIFNATQIIWLVSLGKEIWFYAGCSRRKHNVLGRCRVNEGACNIWKLTNSYCCEDFLDLAKTLKFINSIFIPRLYQYGVNCLCTISSKKTLTKIPAFLPFLHRYCFWNYLNIEFWIVDLMWLYIHAWGYQTSN